MKSGTTAPRWSRGPTMFAKRNVQTVTSWLWAYTERSDSSASFAAPYMLMGSSGAWSSGVGRGASPYTVDEDYAPLEPISTYGAAKLAEESLLSVYAHSHEFTVWTFRFANIVGPRLQLGAVVPDFIQKLRADPSELEILGDGRQEKSYMHISECIEAMCHVVEHADRPVNTYNLGTRTTTSVRTIADVVSEEMGVQPRSPPVNS